MQKQTPLIIGAIIVFIGAGVFFGTQKMKDSGDIPELSQGAEDKNVSGVIQDISGNAVAIKSTANGSTKAPAFTTRTVTINARTKIRQIVPKDPAQLQKELAVYYEKTKQKGTVPAGGVSHTSPPLEYTDTKDVPLSALQVGQSVIVVLPLKNRDKTQFVASEILITPTAEALENMKQSVYQ
jgi:hypothetical protein